MPLHTRALNGLPKELLRSAQLTLTRFPFVRWILTHFSRAKNLGGKKRRQALPGACDVIGTSKTSSFNVASKSRNAGGKILLSILQSLPWLSSNLTVYPEATKKPKLSKLTFFILRSHVRQQKRAGEASSNLSLVNVSCFEAVEPGTISSAQKKHTAPAHTMTPQCSKENPEAWARISAPRIIPTKPNFGEWQTQRGSRKLEQVQSYLNSRKATIHPTFENPFKVLESLSDDEYQVPQCRKQKKNSVKHPLETSMEYTSSILSDTATLVDSAKSPNEEPGKNTTNSEFSTGTFQTFGLKEIPSLILPRKPPFYTTEYKDLEIALLLENRRLKQKASENPVSEFRKNKRFVPIKETPETFRNTSSPPRLPSPPRIIPEDEWQVQGKRRRRNLNRGKTCSSVTQKPENDTSVILPETIISPEGRVANAPA